MTFDRFHQPDRVDRILGEFCNQIPIVVVAIQNILNLMSNLADIWLEEVDFIRHVKYSLWLQQLP